MWFFFFFFFFQARNLISKPQGKKWKNYNYWVNYFGTDIIKRKYYLISSHVWIKKTFSFFLHFFYECYSDSGAHREYKDLFYNLKASSSFALSALCNSSLWRNLLMFAQHFKQYKDNLLCYYIKLTPKHPPSKPPWDFFSCRPFFSLAVRHGSFSNYGTCVHVIYNAWKVFQRYYSV